MATTDDLIIAIRADVGRLESQLREVDRQLNNTRDTSNQATSALKNMALGLVSVGGAVAGLQKLVEVNRQFAILTAGLETATGSAQSASEAFGVLEQFAANTPYSLSQAVDGFTKLVNLGLTPSEAALKSYGDTAAALGKDLSQMIEAVADAATGEFERLKEFGIKAKNNGDTISFTFRGVTETVKNNAAEIEQHLIKLGQVNFDGAMQKRMDTLDGAISNLSDSWDAFFRQLGDSGATDVLKDTFIAVGDAINEVNSMLASGELQGYIEAVGISFSGITEDVANAIDVISNIISAWTSDNQEDIDNLIKFIKDAFLELPQNIRAFVQLGATEFAYLVTMAEMYGKKIANALNPMSPSYNLEQNLKAATQAYQDSISDILAEREKVSQQASERKSKAQNDRQLDDLLNEFNAENKGETLGKFGVKRDKPTADVDEKGKQQEQKKLEQLKKAAQDFLGNIAESNMTESQLDEKHFNESLSQLKKHLNDGFITREQFKKAEIDLNEAFNNKMLDSLVSQYEKEDALELERQQKEDEQRAAKVEQINAFIKDTENAGKTQLELMDAQHAEKMAKLAELMEGEEIYKEQLRQAALDAESQHQAKRLDLMLGTGSKIQELNKAFQKGQLQGALSFFAADFGGMSQHSRKMFELTKAARLADAAMNIPSTVIEAARQGTAMGGWPMGAAMGAAALASQLGQLRAIQSASFGGGSSGGGSSGGGGAPSASSAPEVQAPIQQRFVNINLSGSDNSMYSKSSVRDLITRINDEVKDGAVLRVV